MRKIKAKLREWFSLDYRSLALLRIGIALTIICDLIQRATSLRSHYTDAGVLPRADLLTLWQNKWYISVHMVSGLSSIEALLFIVAGIFAVMLLLGYRTRLAIIASWFLLISLHARNPIVLQGGDVLFRVIVFWMMFLPLGTRYSLDRLFNRIPKAESSSFISPATVAYIIQVCILYIFTAILKTGASWHADGNAVMYALSIDQLITPIGAFIHQFPALMKFLTHATWYTEAFGIILFFIPWKTGYFRIAGILAYVLLQIGFNSGMRLGLFGMIAIVIMLGLLPKEFWEHIVSSVSDWLRKNATPGLRIYYDADCTFCAKISHGLVKFLFLHPSTLALKASTDPTIEKILIENNSWVVVDESGAAHLGWDGVVTVISHAPLIRIFSPVLRIWPVRNIGEHWYRWVANRRRQICEPEIVAAPLTKKGRFIRASRNAVIVFLTVYIIFWNIDTLGHTDLVNQKSEWIGWLTRLDQKFDMFSPTPLTEDGWYVFPGTLKNGTMLDVFTGSGDVYGKPLSYKKPAWVAYLYKDQRWQKFLMNLWAAKFEKFRNPYGKYICREWNKTHTGDEQLQKFDMVFMLEKTLPNGGTETPKPTTIWKHNCF